MRNIMESAVESEYGAIFINAQTAVTIRCSIPGILQLLEVAP